MTLFLVCFILGGVQLLPVAKNLPFWKYVSMEIPALFFYKY